MRLILASTSPRRSDLLSILQIPFEVIPPRFDEVVRLGVPAEQQATDFARGKALAVAKAHPEAVVLGSDTLIECHGDILGKPQHLDDARRMLATLRGRPHRIYTAVALRSINGSFDEVLVEVVTVWMKSWREGVVERYLATNESLGKAGAYAIQGRGADLIERIEGDFTAAVGLPLRATAVLLRKAGIESQVNLEEFYTRRAYANWARFEPVS